MHFLTAEWRSLVMLNWEADPKLFNSLVPHGTALDMWRGKTFLSVIAFRFLNTRVLGVPIPFNVDFEEINLRFYVVREVAGEVRRGVVFIKEIVPRACITAVARLLYNENYVTGKTSHALSDGERSLEALYRWQFQKHEFEVSLRSASDFQDIVPGSREEFIAEHYWGYARQRDGGTKEYRVTHPKWRAAAAAEAILAGNVDLMYGAPWGAILKLAPSFAFIADGSAIAVDFPRRI